jgi:hypothetical protein
VFWRHHIMFADTRQLLRSNLQASIAGGGAGPRKLGLYVVTAAIFKHGSYPQTSLLLYARSSTIGCNHVWSPYGDARISQPVTKLMETNPLPETNPLLKSFCQKRRKALNPCLNIQRRSRKGRNATSHAIKRYISVKF